MLKTRLMTAAAAVALFAAPAAFAQETTPPTPPAQDPAQTPPTLPPEDGEAVAPAASTAAVEAQATTPAQPNSVVAVLRADGRFTTLLSALDAAGLTSTLEAQSAVSIFAPTDEAFAALPEAERTRLMDPANREELRSLLLYHVIAADVSSSQITGARGGVPTAGGAQVQLDGTGDAIKIDEATVVTADIDASNGAIFAIDRVLTPSASQAAMGDEEEVAPAAPAAGTAPATTAPTATSAPAAATAPATTTAPAAETTAPAPTPQSDQADEATTADQPPAEGQEPMSDDAAADDAAADDATPPAGEQTDEAPTDPQA